MTAITAALVKELRDKTGAGMMDCKKALAEANGAVEEAIEVLRKQGLKDLGKRSGKTAAEGAIGIYAHAGSQIVAIVELNCETDFVARTDEFQEAANQLAMHVAAMQPQWVNESAVPADILQKEKDIVLEQLSDAQKEKADKIIPGKLKKFYEESVFLSQPFIKDDSGKKSVEAVVNDLAVKVGEKVSIRRFQRFEVGEGIEKEEVNLADEVAATISGS